MDDMSHVRILRLCGGTVRGHVKVARDLKLVKTRKTGFHILSLKAPPGSTIRSRNAWIRPAGRAASAQQGTRRRKALKHLPVLDQQHHTAHGAEIGYIPQPSRSC